MVFFILHCVGFRGFPISRYISSAFDFSLSLSFLVVSPFCRLRGSRAVTPGCLLSGCQAEARVRWTVEPLVEADYSHRRGRLSIRPTDDYDGMPWQSDIKPYNDVCTCMVKRHGFFQLYMLIPICIPTFFSYIKSRTVDDIIFCTYVHIHTSWFMSHIRCSLPSF